MRPRKTSPRRPVMNNSKNMIMLSQPSVQQIVENMLNLRARLEWR